MQSIWNSLAYVILLSVTASIDGNVRRYSILPTELSLRHIRPL